MSVAVLAVGVVSCGLDPRDGAPADPATTARAENLLQDLYERVMGSVEDRRAQHFLVHAAIHGPVARCMRDAGLTYTLPPFHDPHAGQERVGLPSAFPELPRASVSYARAHGFDVGDRLVAAHQAAATSPDAARFRQRVQAYEALPEGERRAYDARLAVCNRSIPPGAETEDRPSGQQSVYEQLDSVWWQAVQEVDVPADGEQYADCMAAQDIHVESFEGWQSLYGSVLDAYAPFIPDDDGTASLDPAHPDFAAAQRFERRAAVADARCRGEAHARTMQVLLPMLERFSSDHADELAALQDEWAEIRAEAARVGTDWDR